MREEQMLRNIPHETQVAKEAGSGAKKETFFTCFSCASSSVCLLRCFCLFIWQRSVCFLAGELTIRTTVVLNASNQQCLLPDRHLEKTEDMVKFMNDILDGAAEAQAGDGLLQRSKRVIYEAKAAVMVEFIAYSVR
ncbi:protein disulfide-isomerase TMX3-like [Pogoniulus pusillus]|uniref:protein disulfide-isomerase TMX3-like n=1 Tax=Pogoniulus pusillus TaxID=488313 RepID=UPI0030B92344